MTTPTDRAALELAVETTRRESPERRRQIDDMLSSRPWIDVATSCAACAQERALRCRLGGRRHEASATLLPPSLCRTNSAGIARLHCCSDACSMPVCRDTNQIRLSRLSASRSASPQGGDNSGERLTQPAREQRIAVLGGRPMKSRLALGVAALLCVGDLFESSFGRWKSSTACRKLQKRSLPRTVRLLED
jgi:hypothetical protein